MLRSAGTQAENSALGASFACDIPQAECLPCYAAGFWHAQRFAEVPFRQPAGNELDIPEQRCTQAGIIVVGVPTGTRAYFAAHARDALLQDSSTRC